jgi:MSHA biogenesis protein MshP
MCRKPLLSQSWQRQQGSMLVIALFVIVVLAYLGLTVTKLLSASTDNVIYEVLGQRALNAARTGVECRIATTFPIAGASNPYCGTGVIPDLNNVAGLENCQYTASVNEKTVTDGSKSLSYFQFSSTGQCAVGNIVVSRTVYIDAIL